MRKSNFLNSIRVALESTSEAMPAATNETPAGTGDAPGQTPAAPDVPVTAQRTPEEEEALVAVMPDPVEVADAAGDMMLEERECDDEAESIRDAADAVGELEGIAEMADAAGEGDEKRMAVLEVAVESIYTRLGIETVSLAQEAEDSTSFKDRVGALKERIMKLIKAIIEALGRAYDTSRNYMLRVFNVAASVEKQAIEKLREARNIKTGPKGFDTYESGRVISAIYPVQGKLDTGVEEMFDLIEDAVTSAKSGHVQYMKTIIDDFVAGKDVNKLIDGFPDVLVKAFSRPFSYEKDLGDVVELGSSQLPGAKLATLHVPKSLDNLSDFNFQITTIEDSQAPSELPISTMEEVKWMLDGIAKMMSHIRHFEKETDRTSLVRSITESVKRLKDAKVDEISAEDSKFLKSVATMAPALARGIHERTFSYGITTSRALIQHCVISMDSYKQGAKESTKAE